MLVECITKERLEMFYRNCLYLVKLGADLEGFKANYNFLKSKDFSAPKVTSGSKKQSEEEMFAQLCEKKGKEFTKLSKELEAEKAIIETQIKRLKNRVYKTILTRRYLELKTWKEITIELYGGKPDWHIWGNTKYELFTMTLHRRAREKLAEISQVGFVPEQKQIEVNNDSTE